MENRAQLTAAVLISASLFVLVVLTAGGYFIATGLMASGPDQDTVAEPEPIPQDTLTDGHNPELNESKVRIEFIRLVNAERNRTGAGPLTTHSRLDNLSLYHAIDLSENDLSGHTSSDGRSVGDRNRQFGVCGPSLSENVVVFPDPEFPNNESVSTEYQLAEASFEAFVDSEDHYEAMINEENTYTGVGVVLREDGRATIVQTFCHESPHTAN
jgi:uncharacterized protein YkwD